MTITYHNGIRIIREGQPTASTEIDLGNGRAIQMQGTGKRVEKALRKMKSAKAIKVHEASPDVRQSLGEGQ